MIRGNPVSNNTPSATNPPSLIRYRSESRGVLVTFFRGNGWRERAKEGVGGKEKDGNGRKEKGIGRAKRARRCVEASERGRRREATVEGTRKTTNPILIHNGNHPKIRQT